MSSPFPNVYSIGHWTHNPEDFLALLKMHKVTRLVDVRSSPGSRHNPQFNQDNLKPFVESAGIEYIHRKLLGGREKGGDVSLRLQTDPSVSECLIRAVGREDLLSSSASSSPSSSNNAEVKKNEVVAVGASTSASATSTTSSSFSTTVIPTCALMCSEANWHDCHRQNLIHYLANVKNVKCNHIWPDGKLEEHKPGVSQVKLTQKDDETTKALERMKNGTNSISKNGKNNDDDDGDNNNVKKQNISSRIEEGGNMLQIPPPQSSNNNNASKALVGGALANNNNNNGKKKNRLQ